MRSKDGIDSQTTIDATNVYGFGTITETEVTDAQGGTTNNEVQVVTLANATAGTFRLAFNGETAGELNYNATAAQVETALRRSNRSTHFPAIIESTTSKSTLGMCIM